MTKILLSKNQATGPIKDYDKLQKTNSKNINQKT